MLPPNSGQIRWKIRIYAPVHNQEEEKLKETEKGPE
jgi:hypothetical protein